MKYVYLDLKALEYGVWISKTLCTAPEDPSTLEFYNPITPGRGFLRDPRTSEITRWLALRAPADLAAQLRAWNPLPDYWT